MRRGPATIVAGEKQ